MVGWWAGVGWTYSVESHTRRLRASKVGSLGVGSSLVDLAISSLAISSLAISSLARLPLRVRLDERKRKVERERGGQAAVELPQAAAQSARAEERRERDGEARLWKESVVGSSVLLACAAV